MEYHILNYNFIFFTTSIASWQIKFNFNKLLTAKAFAKSHLQIELLFLFDYCYYKICCTFVINHIVNRLVFNNF